MRESIERHTQSREVQSATKITEGTEHINGEGRHRASYGREEVKRATWMKGEAKGNQSLGEVNREHR